jgi:hypothetical protein
VKVTIDDEDVRVVGANWRVTSRLESNDYGRWYMPQIDLIGKFGSPNGPTIAEVRTAKVLRFALKTGMEPPAIEASKTPRVPPPPLASNGGPAFTSAKKPSSELPSELATAPPPTEYDGPDDPDDEILI